MTDFAATARSSFWFKTLFTLSLFGPLINDAKNGGETALLFFLVNLILIWVLSGFLWGIAGVLAIAYGLVPAVFLALLGIMLISGR